MAGELDLPILISQLPNLQQVAGPQIVPADAQQVIFSEIVAEQQRQKEQAVPNVEKDDELAALGQDSGGNKNSGGGSPQGRGHRQPESEETPAETQASNASPWSGNIINIKI